MDDPKMNESFPNRKNELEDFSDSLLFFEVVLLAVIMTIICVATIIGNTLVLVSFFLDKKLRTLNNYFLLSLAVSDIMIGTFSMPLFTFYALNGEWTFGPTLCDMWLAQDYMCSCASSMNILNIAFDRYFSVVSPLWYRARKSGKLVAAMISCVWALALFIFPPWIYLWQYIEGRRTVPDDDCYVQFLETNSYLTVITSTIDYYIPVFIICFLYFRIWRETVKRKRFLAAMDAENKSTAPHLQPESSKSERHMFNAFCSSKPPLPNEKNYEYLKEKVELVTMATSYPEITTTKPLSETSNNSGKTNCDQIIAISPETNFSNEKRAGNENVLHRLPSTDNPSVKQDNKAARMLAAILCAFFVTATPYNVVVLIKNFDTSRTLVPDAAWFFFYYLFYVNSALNPVCYALANERFRKTYWKILKCSWKKKFYDSSSFSSSTEKKSNASKKSNL